VEKFLLQCGAKEKADDEESEEGGKGKGEPEGAAPCSKKRRWAKRGDEEDGEGGGECEGEEEKQRKKQVGGCVRPFG
jgi:hypothetical protein